MLFKYLITVLIVRQFRIFIIIFFETISSIKFFSGIF